MPDLRVLVPMKSLDIAKMRLAPCLSNQRRRALVLLMLQGVLGAAGAAIGVESCAVIGGDKHIKQLTRAHGWSWWEEEGTDLNSSLWAAMKSCWDGGAEGVLFLPGDLPDILSADVRRLVVASENLTNPIGVRAEGDGGTNALLLPKECVFPPAFGEQSYSRHERLVAYQGRRLITIERSTIRFDIDTPDDLASAQIRSPELPNAIDRWEERLSTWA